MMFHRCCLFLTTVYSFNTNAFAGLNPVMMMVVMVLVMTLTLGMRGKKGIL